MSLPQRGPPLVTIDICHFRLEPPFTACYASVRTARSRGEHENRRRVFGFTGIECRTMTSRRRVVSKITAALASVLLLLAAAGASAQEA